MRSPAAICRWVHDPTRRWPLGGLLGRFEVSGGLAVGKDCLPTARLTQITLQVPSQASGG